MTPPSPAHCMTRPGQLHDQPAGKLGKDPCSIATIITSPSSSSLSSSYHRHQHHQDHHHHHTIATSTAIPSTAIMVGSYSYFFLNCTASDMVVCLERRGNIFYREKLQPGEAARVRSKSAGRFPFAVCCRTDHVAPPHLGDSFHNFWGEGVEATTPLSATGINQDPTARSGTTSIGCEPTAFSSTTIIGRGPVARSTASVKRGPTARINSNIGRC